MSKRFLFFLSIIFFLFSCTNKLQYDFIIRNGIIYDGTGNKSFKGDIGINADTIAFIGDLSAVKATNDIDAKGMAVSPGFIDVQSQSMESLIQDGRSLGAIKQGVTLEVFGEGESMGPLTDTLKKIEEKQEHDIKYKIEWTSLKDYLQYLQKRGVSTNVASFAGAATIRENVLLFANRFPDSSELNKMKLLVKQAMEDGALGIGSALIYAPGAYAKTDELIELCKVAASYGGVYISHIRSEGNQLLQGADELIKISKEANIPAMFYHLKAAGKNNWYKIAIEKIIVPAISPARLARFLCKICRSSWFLPSPTNDMAMV